MRQSIEQQWYGRPHWLLLLVPLAWLYGLLSSRRRKRLSSKQQPNAVPVIVIGNLSVGGTGKTPFIIALATALQNRGVRVGVIARGYGGSLDGNRIVTAADHAQEVGDEPAFLYQALSCPVAVGQDRVRSVELLAEANACDVILSDDGLQHYRLQRQMEIVLIDGARGFGNGWLLPVGPLREPTKRLVEVDMIVVNGALQQGLPEHNSPTYHLSLQPVAWRNVKTGLHCDLDSLDLAAAQAIAGIGHPRRFFDQLIELGFSGGCQSFPDHFSYSESDLDDYQNTRLLMTEKDAIKCQSIAGDDWWALKVGFELPDLLVDSVHEKLQHSRA